MKYANKFMPLITATALILGAAISFPALSAKSDENLVQAEADKTQAEADKKLAEAQRRLAEAAREVAELSMSKSKGPNQRFEFRLYRGVLGAVISKTDKDSKGVPITSVSPGGGAEAAGLRSGDIITSIKGESLVGEGASRKLIEELQTAKVGDKVAVTYERDGKSVKTDVEVKELSNNGFAFNMGMPGQGGPGEKRFILRREGSFGSAEFAPLTAKLGQYFGTDKGLLVVRAPEDVRLKLEDGDVIVDIDGRVPNNPGHALKILASYQVGEKVRINVMRMKKRQTFEVTIPQDAPVAHRASFVLPPMPQIELLPEMPVMPEMPASPDIT